MPTYIYGCSQHEQEREEVVHPIGHSAHLYCGICGQPLHRIPQAFRFYHDPQGVLLDELDGKYRDYRVREERKRHGRS